MREPNGPIGWTLTAALLAGAAACVMLGVFEDPARHSTPGPTTPAPTTPGPVAKLTLTVYGSDGCPWCVRLAKAMEEPAAAKALARFEVAEVKDPGKAAAAKVHAFPTLVVAEAGGKELGRHEGYMASRELAAWLDALGR